MPKEYYNLLEVDENASPDQIKTNYKKLALKYHPDRNKEKGAEEMFKKISRAYEVLSDPQKRANYDRGFDESNNNGNVDLNDILNNVFGGSFNMGGFNMFQDMFGFQFNNKNQKNKAPEKYVNVEISLEDLYKGTIYKSFVFLKRKCSDCDGVGGKNKKCDQCNGAGKIQKVIQQGNMVQTFISECSKCNSSGNIIISNCEKCKGNGVLEQSFPIEVSIDKGALNGSTITLKDQGDDYKGCIRGDLILKLKELKHSIFKRNGNDLIYDMEISLLEALGGFEYNLLHVNEKILHLKSNEIVDHNQVTVIENYGMPIMGSNRFGNLIINYKIKYPDHLSDKKLKILKDILPNNVKRNTNDLHNKEIIEVSIYKKN